MYSALLPLSHWHYKGKNMSQNAFNLNDAAAPALLKCPLIKTWLLWIKFLCMSVDHGSPMSGSLLKEKWASEQNPLSNFPPPVVSSKLNLHNWGWSCFPFIVHNSWEPWQLLCHWPIITHGTPPRPHPWDPTRGRDKGSERTGLQRVCLASAEASRRT